MRKVIISFFMMAIAAAAYGQRPDTGDQLLNAGLIDLGPTLKGSFLVFKKYKNSMNAHRFGVSLLSTYFTTKDNFPSYYVDNAPPSFFETYDRVNRSKSNLTLSFFYGRQKNLIVSKRMEVYGAADLAFAIRSYTETTRAEIMDTLYNNIPTPTSHSAGDYFTTKTTNPIILGLNANLSLGINYFISKRIAVGAELKATVGRLNYDTEVEKTSEVSTNGTLTSTQAHFNSVRPMNVEFVFIPSGYITVSYCFK